MLAEGLELIFSNFALAMLLLAVIFMIIHRLIAGKRISEAEIVFRWTSLLALGFTGIYAFIMHFFFPHIASASIGWIMSPFEYEVAMADLALGVLGILSFRASFGFRIATVIAASICFWGDALNHIYEIIFYKNYSIGNAGSWLVMDILIPLILWVSLLKLPSRPRHSK